MASRSVLGSFFVRTRNALRHRTGLSSAIRNTSWLLADRIFRLLMGFAVGIWLARYLGPEKYGELNYAIAFVSLFSVVALLPIDGVVVRHLVQRPEDRGVLLGSTWAMKLAGAVTGLALAVLVIVLLRPQDTRTAWLVGILSLAPLFQSADAADCWFQARVASRYTVIARGCGFLLVSGVRVALILGGAAVAAFAWAIVGEALLGGVGMVVAYWIFGGRLTQWRPSVRQARLLLAEAWPLLLSGLLIMVYMRIDQVMLGEFGGFDEVGSYSVAVRLVEVWYTVPVALTASLFPAIVRSKELGEAVYTRRIRLLYGAMLWLALAVALPVTFLSGWIVELLYGPAYAPASAALALLCWMAVWVFFGLARQRWLFTENALRAGMAVEITGCTLNVLLNLIFIPRWGAMGAAGASLLATTAANLLVACFSSTIRRSLLMLVSSVRAPLELLRAA